MQKELIQKVRWIAVGAVVFGAIGAIVLVARKQHTAAKEYERDRQARCVKTSLSPEQQETCKYKRDSPQNYLSWWYVLVAWPEGITVWAIIGTGVIIGWQSFATYQSAKAAARGIEIQVAGQRAWVVIRSGMDGSYTPSTQEEPRFAWIIKNYGKTPAQIIQTQCAYELVYRCHVYHLPEPPPYPDPIPLSGIVLVPKEPMYFSRFLENRLDRMSVLHSLDDSQICKLEEGEMLLLAYGYVRYRDGISDKIRESRFIANYAWRRPSSQQWEFGFRPVLEAPSQYTECT